MKLKGKSIVSQTPFEFESVEFFQVSEAEKIARLTSYFDTYLITGAA